MRGHTLSFQVAHSTNGADNGFTDRCGAANTGGRRGQGGLSVARWAASGALCILQSGRVGSGKLLQERAVNEVP